MNKKFHWKAPRGSEVNVCHGRLCNENVFINHRSQKREKISKLDKTTNRAINLQ